MPSKSLQELHAEIDIDLVNCVLSIIPGDWWAACMDVKYLGGGELEDEFSVSIYNPETGSPCAEIPSDEIFSLIRRHFLVFRENAKNWVEVKYIIRFDEENDSWGYVIEYGY